MRKILVQSAILSLFAVPAFANGSVTEGRSVNMCSSNTLVCAFMKDGTSKPTSECQAQQEGAIRVLTGDCYDED